MRRVDAVLVAIAVVLAVIWYMLRVAGPSESVAVPVPAAPAVSSPARPSPSSPVSTGAGAGGAATSTTVETTPHTAGVEVVHKHKLGSCHGWLAATASSLRYAPTRAGDGFDVPRAAIEHAEMDARKKALVVKLRGGRAYTFTEPGGGGEHLAALLRSLGTPKTRAVP
jgi:hypothetical protein